MACPPSQTLDPSAACPGDWPVLSLQQNVAQTIELQLQDAGGNNLEVPDAEEVPAPGDDPDPGSSPTIIVVASGSAVGAATAKLWMREHMTMDVVVEVDGGITEDGLVTLEFSVANVSHAGVYVGTVLLFNDDGDVVFAKNVYCDIEPNATGGASNGRPLDIGELRMLLRDECADGNPLLDAVEFSGKELAFCIGRAIDEWNETPPHVGTYTPKDFPWRFWWGKSAMSQALFIAARWYARNALSYSAAGVSVADKDKASVYLEMARELRAEWREWMRSQKIYMNVESGFGTVGGRWSR